MLSACLPHAVRRSALHRRCGTARRHVCCAVPGLQRITSCCAAPGHGITVNCSAGCRRADWEGKMKRHDVASAIGTLLCAVFALVQPAPAQNTDFYAGKTLRIVVGLEAGGTVDTAARQFAVYLRKHLAGNPNILVQNMPGAGGAVATNYLAEKAA